MRYLRFDDQGTPRHAVLADTDRLLDLKAAGLEHDGPAWTADEHALARIVRAKPPAHSLRRLERAALLAPTGPRHVVQAGGHTSRMEAPAVVSPGGDLPAGSWTTGVAAVYAPRGTWRKDQWADHVAGFAPFHALDQCLSFGPWIVGRDEVREPLGLAFSAFVDDLSRIRPAKALLDWGSTFAAARDEGLEPGDLVCLAAPPQDIPAGSDLRAALVYDGAVVARLENRVV